MFSLNWESRAFSSSYLVTGTYQGQIPVTRPNAMKMQRLQHHGMQCLTLETRSTCCQVKDLRCCTLWCRIKVYVLQGGTMRLSAVTRNMAHGTWTSLEQKAEKCRFALLGADMVPPLTPLNQILDTFSGSAQVKRSSLYETAPGSHLPDTLATCWMRTSLSVLFAVDTFQSPPVRDYADERLFAYRTGASDRGPVASHRYRMKIHEGLPTACHPVCKSRREHRSR